MEKRSKLICWDAAGKFDAVKEKAHQKCWYQYDLTMYSLTPKGESKPTRLILKLTPIGKPDNYLSMRKGVLMHSLSYQTFPPEDLTRICSVITAKFLLEISWGGHYAVFTQGDDPFRVRPVSVANFFALEPCKDEPGAQSYLQDKAFFLSVPSDLKRLDYVPPLDSVPDRKNPVFAALKLLKNSEKAEVLSIDMSCADIGGKLYLNRLFEGYQNLRQLDLSAFDTTGVMEMGKMFFGCRSLQQLDLSSFDFSKVRHVDSMFGECFGLKQVILSDTILQARCIKTIQSFEGYTDDQLSDIWRHEYITAGPQLADMAVERASEVRTRWVTVPFCEASEAEVRKELGVSGTTKITIVPHRPLKK